MAKYGKLTDEEVQALTAELCYTRARARDIEGSLRGHVRAGAGNIEDVNGIFVDTRQSLYSLINPGLVAIAMIDELFPRSLVKRLHDAELENQIDVTRDVLLNLLLDGNPKSHNKRMSQQPGQEKLKELMARDEDGGTVRKNGKTANLAVRYSAPDEQTTTVLQVGELPLAELEGIVTPDDLLNRMAGAEDFERELPTAPLDDDSDEEDEELDWQDPGLPTRDFREKD